MTPMRTAATLVAIALLLLSSYALMHSMPALDDNLPPELQATMIEPQEITVAADEPEIEISFFGEEGGSSGDPDASDDPSSAPSHGEAELRVAQVDSVFSVAAHELQTDRIHLAREELEPAIEAASASSVDVELWVEGERIASRPLAFATEAAVPPTPPRISWSLSAADAAYDPERFFEVPVRIVAQVTGSEGPVVAQVEKSIAFLLRDLEGGLDRKRVEVQEDRAMSDPVFIPLRPRDRYRLVAEPIGGEGPATDPVEITWESHGPALELLARPANQERFSSRLDPARLSIFWALNGRRVRPPGGARLITNPPPGVTLDPAMPTLDSEGIWTANVYAASTLPAARISFDDSELGLTTAAEVSFSYPRLQLVLAILCGVLGVVAAQRRAILQQSWLAIVLEVVTSTVAAGLLYVALVAGWLPAFPGMLGIVPAIVIGIVGGYAGDGVFHLLIKGFLPGPAPARDTVPDLEPAPTEKHP